MWQGKTGAGWRSRSVGLWPTRPCQRTYSSPTRTRSSVEVTSSEPSCARPYGREGSCMSGHEPAREEVERWMHYAQEDLDTASVILQHGAACPELPASTLSRPPKRRSRRP